MQPVAQRDLARLRTRRLALRHYCCLLRRAPTSPSRCPSQHFNATETVPINWQITWHTIPPTSNKQGRITPSRHPTQGGGRAPLTIHLHQMPVFSDECCPKRWIYSAKLRRGDGKIKMTACPGSGHH